MDDKNTNGKGHFLESIKEFFKKDLVQYIVKRLLMFIPTLFLISVLAFFVIQLPEIDYVDREIAKLAAEGEFVSQEEADALRAEYGLDLPMHERYLKWISGIIWTPTDSAYYRLYGSHHDWKYSFAYGKNVWDVIDDRLGLTILVSALIMIFQYAISLPIAVYASTHQYSVGDYVSSFIGFIGAAIPNFILAFMLMYWSYKWTGNANVGLDMLDEVGKQYTLTARAKGVPERKIVMKYCFRAAINPTVSGLGGVLSSLFSGSTVTAMVLMIDIQGPELLKSLQTGDVYLAGGIVMTQAILVVIGILLSDIALAFLDPRIRYSGGGR